MEATQETQEQEIKEKKRRVNTKTKRNLEFLKENGIWQRKSIMKVLRISYHRAGYYVDLLKKEEEARANRVLGGVEAVAEVKPANVVPNEVAKTAEEIKNG